MKRQPSILLGILLYAVLFVGALWILMAVGCARDFIPDHGPAIHQAALNITDAAHAQRGVLEKADADVHAGRPKEARAGIGSAIELGDTITRQAQSIIGLSLKVTQVSQEAAKVTAENDKLKSEFWSPRQKHLFTGILVTAILSIAGIIALRVFTFGVTGGVGGFIAKAVAVVWHFAPLPATTLIDKRLEARAAAQGAAA